MELIENLAKATNAKIAVTPVVKHLCKLENPLYLGITGVAGHKNLLEYAKTFKGIIIIGTTLSLMTRFGLEQYLDSQPVLYTQDTSNCEFYAIYFSFSKHLKIRNRAGYYSLSNVLERKT